MVKLNTKPLKPDTRIQKNVLYQINENRVVSVREEHKDCADIETVNLRYVLGDGQYAVFANEFRSPNVSKQGCKSADVLTCLIDDENKQIYTLILWNSFVMPCYIKIVFCCFIKMRVIWKWQRLALRRETLRERNF